MLPEETSYPLSVIPGYHSGKKGIQIGIQLRADATDEEMRFARQLGVQWVMVTPKEPFAHSKESYRAISERFKSRGLKIYRLGNNRCHNMEEITLNLKGRDEKLAEYLHYIRNLGKAGIHYSTYAHMANGIWSSGREAIRGGATGRSFHIQSEIEGRFAGQSHRGELTHGRLYTEEELWENYRYFIEQVVPVAKEAEVYIGIHPDDPPVYPLGGIPRCLFGSFEGYQKAIEIADSPHIGVCLCAGCWLEGGSQMGNDVLETIRYFGERKKLFKIHFRNVTAPMPGGFTETYLDHGYMDMTRIVRAMKDVGFDGAIISDHLPEMVGGHATAEAFAIGYMKALVQAVTSN